ncbi:rod shape-determining protein MreC [Patescibacteria group bacterium]
MNRFIKSRWGMISLAGLIIVLLIILNSFSLLSPLQSVTIRALEPLESVSTYIESRLENFTGFFASRKNLVDENQLLYKRIEELLVENQSISQSMDELAILREEKEFLDEATYESIIGKIIGRSAFPSARSFIINRGSSHGVFINAPVITERGIVVGKIIEVSQTSSLMNVVTDPSSEFVVHVENDSGSTGIVRGSHGISLELYKIPYDDTLEVDQRVVTTGSEQHIPPNLLIGTVEEIEYQEGELFQSATVRHPSDIENLSIIAIIIQ